ncbi:MAG TPA: ribbon-helix-helix domain-containing protein [Chloroflexota bacterium]|nr:ribbon-helix-helix domain-containing protein [Chloroflexota bacterium]
MGAGIVRTTLSLPRTLLERTDELVKQGEARSRNELVTAALRRELAARERARIDAQIRMMAHDEADRREADRIMRELDAADRETIERLEPYPAE